MAKNRHGVKEDRYFKCSKCEDRGYTFMLAKQGIMTMCDCIKGVDMGKKFDEARTDLGTHRKFSREGVKVRR
jgi:hypothetical protein